MTEVTTVEIADEIPTLVQVNLDGGVTTVVLQPGPITVIETNSFGEVGATGPTGPGGDATAINGGTA